MGIVSLLRNTRNSQSPAAAAPALHARAKPPLIALLHKLGCRMPNRARPRGVPSVEPSSTTMIVHRSSSADWPAANRGRLRSRLLRCRSGLSTAQRGVWSAIDTAGRSEVLSAARSRRAFAAASDTHRAIRLLEDASPDAIRAGRELRGSTANLLVAPQQLIVGVDQGARS